MLNKLATLIIILASCRLSLHGISQQTQALDNIQVPTFHQQKSNGGSVWVLQAHPCVSLQCFYHRLGRQHLRVVFARQLFLHPCRHGVGTGKGVCLGGGLVSLN